jgi:hypothetical protein
VKAYYFGCWNQAGHYLFGPHGSHVPYEEREKIELYADGLHLESSLAPRRTRDGKIACRARGASTRDRDMIHNNTAECPQGQCLVHHLPNGFTAMQWWDRCQGDTRGACNSTVLLEGEHDFETMVAALREHFPTVAANLDKAGVELVLVEASP